MARTYKLKRWPKIVLVLIILGSIFIPIIKNKVDEYLYTKTNEYALIKLGYTEEETKLILDKLTDEEESTLMTYQYNEFIPEFIKCKYFMFKNLDGYLGQVITKEDDFFKYHGVEGYDYDNIVALVNTQADKPFYTETKSADITKNYAILSNKFHGLGSDYVPDDLVDISIKYYYGDKKQIRSEVYEAFKEMWEKAMEEGIYLIIVSAYRDYDSQVRVYNDYENSKGTTYADSIAARPGFSEHQTGLALDIYSKDNTLASTFKNSKAYEWLLNNSYKYGFILRYPEGKKNITGASFEPWHYRYLGKELATKVYNEGITYDEYYAYFMDE